MHTNNTLDYFSPQARRARMVRANHNPTEDRKTLAAYSDAELKAQRKALAAAIRFSQARAAKKD